MLHRTTPVNTEINSSQRNPQLAKLPRINFVKLTLEGKVDGLGDLANVGRLPCLTLHDVLQGAGLNEYCSCGKEAIWIKTGLRRFTES